MIARLSLRALRKKAGLFKNGALIAPCLIANDLVGHVGVNTRTAVGRLMHLTVDLGGWRGRLFIGLAGSQDHTKAHGKHQ